MEQEPATQHDCPYCGHKKIETVATAPYVRGFLIAYQIGSKKYIGCVSCVRKKVLGEAGLSAVIGWFSITSIFINPFLILYNLLQGGLIKPDRHKVTQTLSELGISESSSNSESSSDVDIIQIGYGLAASMIAADGKIEAEEIEAATNVGHKIFEGFDDNKFNAVLNNHKDLPSVNDLSIILKDVLDEKGKKMVYTYLKTIAMADGNLASEEQTMLDQVAKNLEISTVEKPEAELV